jgi:hypothetical protein
MSLMRALCLTPLLLLPLTMTWAQEAIDMDRLTLDPLVFEGKEVTITDCLLLGLNDVVGAQCTSVPMNSRMLAYIDVATWTPASREVLYACPLTDIMNLCVLEVTGTVTVNASNLAVITNATVVELRRAPAI